MAAAEADRGEASQSRYVDSGVTSDKGRPVISGDLEQALVPHVELLARDSDGTLLIVPRGLVASSPEAVQRSVDGIGFVMRNFSGVGLAVLAVDAVDYQPLGLFADRDALVENLVSRLQGSGLEDVTAGRVRAFPELLTAPDGEAPVLLRVAPVN